MKPSEPRKVTGADGPTGPPAGRQGGTQQASDPSQGLQAARVGAVDTKVWPDDYGWGDLMTLLDAHWPGDVFGDTIRPLANLRGDRKHDAGIRIVALLRWVDSLQADDAAGLVANLMAEIQWLKKALRCGAEHPENETVIPCILDKGHTSQHVSSTGCAGSEVRWPSAVFYALMQRDGALAEVERLRRWKAEAKPVMDGLQELGDALGISLGQRITGAEAVAAVEALVAEVEQLKDAYAEREQRWHWSLIKAQTARLAVKEARREHTDLAARVLALAGDADEVWRIHQAMTNHSADHRPCESGARKKFADRLRALVTAEDRVTIERVKGEALPKVAYPGPNDTDDGMFERMAWNLRNGYPAGGSNSCDALARLIDREVARSRAAAYRTTEPTEETRDNDVLRVTVSERDATIERVRRALSDGEDDWDGRPGLLFDVLSAIAVALDGSPDPDASPARATEGCDLVAERDAAIAKHTAFVAALLALADRADRTPVSNDPFRVGIDIADDIRALVTTEDRATIERVKGEALPKVAYPGPNALARLIDREVARCRAATYRATAPTEAVTGDYWHGPDRTEPTEGESE